MRGAAAFAAGEPPPDESSGSEELELGLSLGVKKPCRILTARDLPMLSPAMPPAAAASPDSSVSSSSAGAPPQAAAAAAASKRAKAGVGPATASPEAAGSGHPPGYGLVGWPPIRTFRMNSLFSQSKDNASEPAGAKKTADIGESKGIKEEEDEKKGRPVGRVKVFMDGEVIGRKVDLNAHRSYDSLALALELMFAKPSIILGTSSCAKALKLLDGNSEYQLTYEDKDGDWMLVGDVPWEMFVESVKQLRIMRTSDSNVLDPRLQGLNRSPGLATRKPS